MGRNDKHSWEAEFREFADSEAIAVPEAVSAQLFETVHEELNPKALSVFTKVVLFQAIVGFVSLLFCPQFGISLTSSLGIMPYLMKFGESVCMLGCGALFAGLSLMAASLFLRPEEVRALKQHEVLHLVSLATLSLGAFLCLGGEVVFTLGLVWLFGAVLGGVVSLETGWALRRVLAGRVLI